MEKDGKNSAPASGGEMVIVPRDQIVPKFIECDMCGHKNPEDKELCEKCSNYLKG